MKPLVSVIVPCYNHARYLPQRLESLEAQRYPHLEFILLDDASPDHSLSILKEWAAGRPRTQVIANAQNSGSPFIQWNRGAARARGRYLWIAESDDYAHPDLVEKLVAQMERHPHVALAYAQSMLVDEDGRELHSYEENLRFIYQSDAWQKDFVVAGPEACRRWLFYHNPIPNASGLLIRRSAYQEVGGADEKMRLNGDWHLYARILLHYNLAFVSQELNYFRTHTQSQRSASRRRATVYQELLAIHDLISGALPEATQEASSAKSEFANWWIGNLPYHALTRENWRLNRQLYRRFAPVKKHLPYRILLTYVISYLRDFFRWAHLLKPLKKWRGHLFPGKYWNQ
jgi:glycosyltransferase involved in cell wall biosynthesis